MVRNSLAGFVAGTLGVGAAVGSEVVAGAGATAAGAGVNVIVSLGPRRKRMRSSPSRKSISVRSCRPMSATKSLIVRMSNGPGTLDDSFATTTPITKFQESNSKNQGAKLPALVLGIWLLVLRFANDY